MWKTFDGKPYTREEFAAHVAALTFPRRVRFVTLHNTGGPTLAQWYAGGATPAQRIKNLEYYYEVNQHWHAGPHLFIDRDHIWGFSDLTAPGVHASCFNQWADGSYSIGIEMVGDYGSEPFDPHVRDNTVFALGVLHRKLGIRPDGLKYGVAGLHFHIDCKADGHACPGKHVDRADMIARTLAEMARQDGGKAQATAAAPSAVPSNRVNDAASLQAALNALGASPRLDVDGDIGPATIKALAPIIEAALEAKKPDAHA